MGSELPLDLHATCQVLVSTTVSGLVLALVVLNA